MNKFLILIAPALAITSAALADEMQLSIEIPRLEVAEYHRPYVAAWIEKPDQTMAANLVVWYDIEKADAEGETWLKDLRQWWRKSGRALKMPVDGVSGPTRPAGTHRFEIPAEKAALPPLADGEYQLVVEASREVGGRELVKIPFKWDGKAAVDASAAGKSELGKIHFTITAKASN